MDGSEEGEANDHGIEQGDQVAAMVFDDNEDQEILDDNGRAPSPPKTPSIVSEGDIGGARPETSQAATQAAQEAALGMGPDAPPSPDSPAANHGSLEDMVNYLRRLSQDDTYQRFVEAFLDIEAIDTVRLSTSFESIIY